MTLPLESYPDVETFLAALKQARRGQKLWIFFQGTVADKTVQLKTYAHTYMQIFRIEGMNQHLSPMDCKVSEFEDAIRRGFNS